MAECVTLEENAKFLEGDHLRIKNVYVFHMDPFINTQYVTPCNNLYSTERHKTPIKIGDRTC